MNTQVLRRVRTMFNCPDAPKERNRAYQRKWVRAIRVLGDKWLFAKPINRVNH